MLSGEKASIAVSIGRGEPSTTASAPGEPDGRRPHLGAAGDVEGRVHDLRRERLMLALVAEEAVVVVPLVLARASLERRVRLLPADRAWIDREPPEHAPGL